MGYKVYILQSAITQKFYCGQTDNIELRLIRHNNGEVKSTKHAKPWKLLFALECNARQEAMQLEKQIKKRGIGRWMNDFQSSSFS